MSKRHGTLSLDRKLAVGWPGKQDFFGQKSKRKDKTHKTKYQEPPQFHQLSDEGVSLEIGGTEKSVRILNLAQLPKAAYNFSQRYFRGKVNLKNK